MIKVIELKGKRELKKFINFQWDVYKNDENWVAPLKGDLMKTLLGIDNPLFMNGEHAFFMVYEEEKPKGRICVGINESLNDKKNFMDGYFTLFECVRDEKIAFALLDKAAEWLKSRGVTILKGPVSPTNGDDYRGLLVRGFDGPPVLMNSYNPPYYMEYLEKYGFEKHLDLLAFFYNVQEADLERHGKIAEYAMKRYNFQVDKINLTKMDAEMEDIKRILDIAMPEDWEDLTPPTIEEVRAEGAKLKPLADENLIFIARAEGRPIGFAIALPDYNQVLKKINGNLLPTGFLKYLWYKRKITGLRIFILFVIPEFRKKGVSGAMFYRYFKEASKRGYIYAEGSTIGEINVAMRNEILRSGGEEYRTYRLYKKEI